MAVFGDERWNRNRYDSTGEFDLLQGFGSVASWGANHGIGKMIYGGFDWDDPRSMNRWSQMPVLGNIFGARRDEISQKQNDDYFAELGKWMDLIPMRYRIAFVLVCSVLDVLLVVLYPSLFLECIP